MTLEIEVSTGGHQLHIAEKSATRVPTRIVRFARIGLHGNHILLSQLQLVRYVYLEAHIAIVCSAYVLTVQVDIAHIHDAPEVEQKPSALQRVGRRKVQAIPRLSHLLEAPTAQSALDVGCHVGVVSLFVSIRSHPGLFYLEVVRHVDGAPAVVVEFGRGCVLHVAGMEFPTKVQVLHNRSLRHEGHSHSQREKRQYISLYHDSRSLILLQR